MKKSTPRAVILLACSLLIAGSALAFSPTRAPGAAPTPQGGLPTFLANGSLL